MTTWYFLQAQDVWMFRDSKPFAAGASFLATSIFPPTPQTMQGIIRTHLYELGAAYGDAQTLPDGFQIQGPFVGRWSGGKPEIYIPLPLDVMVSDGKLHLMQVGEANYGYQTNLPQEIAKNWRPLVLPSDVKAGKQEEGRWIRLADYLGGDLSNAQTLKTDALFEREPRTGIGLNAGRRTAEDKMFYNAEFIRPRQDVGLLVGVNKEVAEAFGASGILAMGGEGRCATYQQVTYTPPAVSVGDNLKLVLLTPAYFSEGWRPKGGWGDFGTLVSAALGKPQPISGWDVANGKPKPLYHFMPAGSVYYFQGGSYAGDIPFTETPANTIDYGHIGFGQVAVGTW